jgi:RNA polymerase primary sigma factor
MMASADEPNDAMGELLRIGERLGYLTYEMLNEKLPDEIVSPEKLDAFLAAIDSKHIRLIDEPDAPKAS